MRSQMTFAVTIQSSGEDGNQVSREQEIQERRGSRDGRKPFSETKERMRGITGWRV